LTKPPSKIQKMDETRINGMKIELRALALTCNWWIDE